MATADLERMLEAWAIAWSSTENTDPERLLALFADDCVFEDAAFGVVVQDNADLRRYVRGELATVPDFTFGVTRQFATSQWAAIEWIMSGTHKGDFPGMPATGQRFASVRGASILELEAGNIRRESDYWYATTIMK
jgi:steroid delta-isomerase-like uncharacterized protein